MSWRDGRAIRCGIGMEQDDGTSIKKGTFCRDEAILLTKTDQGKKTLKKRPKEKCRELLAGSRSIATSGLRRSRLIAVSCTALIFAAQTAEQSLGVLGRKAVLDRVIAREPLHQRDRRQQCQQLRIGQGE